MPQGLRAAIAGLRRQALRFLLVGGTATAIDALLYLLLLRIGLDPRLCNAISYPSSGIAAFWMHRHWTFEARDGSWKGQALRFGVMVTAGLTLSSAIIAITVPLVGPLPAKFLAVAGTLALNFSISRWIVFVPAL